MSNLLSPLTNLLGGNSADFRQQFGEFSTDDKLVQFLFDRAAITDVITRLPISYDLQDWTLYRECLADEAVWQLSPVFGDYSSSALRPAEELVAQAKQFFEQLEATQHIYSNYTVNVKHDAADCTAYFHALHFLQNDKGSDQFLQIGYYNFNLIRAERGWLVSKAVQTVTRNVGNWSLIEKAMGKG